MLRLCLAALLAASVTAEAPVCSVCSGLSQASRTSASACPANSASLFTNATSITDCACIPGSFATPVAYGVACTPCAAGSFNNQPGSTTCATNKVCAPGTWPSDSGTPTTDYICEPCPANYVCSSNVKIACQSGTVSNAGSSEYRDCACAGGSFGAVTSISTNTCAACPIDSFCSGVPCKC